MEKVDCRLASHVVMKRDHLNARAAQCLQHPRHFSRFHRHVACNHCIGIRPGERGPGVETHARVNPGAVLTHVDIGSADRDLVDRAVLLAFLSHNRCELRTRQARRERSAGPLAMDDELFPIRSMAGLILVARSDADPVPCTCM